ncbi:MAG: papain fold toxin domain-containing protein [Rhizonema sp. PD38]|nr:papain fold toxin domain-containing protein [Rhizonema sp. PD38]
MRSLAIIQQLYGKVARLLTFLVFLASGLFIKSGVDITEIRLEQIEQVRALACEYKNFECVECTFAIKEYLVSQGINGKQIKLYTGSGIGRDSYIYDDNVPGDAISINGRHQAISIYINEVETIFDNHHHNGICKTQ